jgi:hypothetical protein
MERLRHGDAAPSYLRRGMSPTIETEEEPVSTFPVNTDPSSYALALSHLARGVLPDAAAVRVEDFINRFDYHYAAGDELLRLHLEAFPSPFRAGYHVLRLGLKAHNPQDARTAIARDVTLQVMFDAASVVRYRLLGYEGGPPTSGFTNELSGEGELAAGHSVTALYEVKLLPGTGPLGTLRIRYQPADAGAPRMLEQTLARSAFVESFSGASPSAQLALVSAAFAEKLRGSYWVRGVSYRRLLGVWEQLPASLRKTPQVQELGTLIQRAQTLDTRPDPYERLAPLAALP